MIETILKEAGVLLEGHFLLSSGRHSERYCQCARLFENREQAKQVIAPVAKQLKEVDYDLIVGPAMGGIHAAYELSIQTGKRNIFIERVAGQMEMRRGFEIKPGEKVVIMEDVVTTGKSALEVAKVIEAYGGTVVALACIIDRRVTDVPFPIFSAIQLQEKTFSPDDCPLCQEGIPFIKPGSRKIG